MDWKECRVEIETWDVSFWWRFTPMNRFTRLLWKWLEFYVEVDWVKTIGEAEKKRGGK